MPRSPAPVLTAALLGALVSCKGAPAEPAGTQPDAPAASASATAGNVEQAPNPAMGLPAVLSDAHWKDFPGPKRAASIGDAKKAWGIRPVSDSFESVSCGLLSVKQVDGDVVIVDGYVPAHVPAVFLQAPRPAQGLKPGAPVVVDSGGAAPAGRVVTVGAEVAVKYLWHGSVAEISVAPDRVLALSGKLAFAEPVVYRVDKVWHHGHVAHAGPGQLWVVGAGGKPQRIDSADARAVATRRVLAKGDAVRAERLGVIADAEIAAVLDEGVAYEVRFGDDGSKSVLPYDSVVDPR
jgi:hypothetical protein